MSRNHNDMPAPSGQVIESPEVRHENTILESHGISTGTALPDYELMDVPASINPVRLVGGYSLGKSGCRIETEGAVGEFVNAFGHGPHTIIAI